MEFKLETSHDGEIFTDATNGWLSSQMGGDDAWWQSVILNPKIRWQYRALNNKVNLDTPRWVKSAKLKMKGSVNQYFGIYKLEFYTKTNNLVMIQSQQEESNLCLSVSNGLIGNNSEVIGKLLNSQELRRFDSFG